MAYFHSLFSGNSPPPLCMNVDGTAGTGKSFLIAAVCTALKDLAQQHGMTSNPVVRLAPTGISAFGIQGYTIHAGLSIPAKKWSPLSTGAKQRLQQCWKDYKLIIIDEKSIVGRGLMGKIDS